MFYYIIFYTCIKHKCIYVCTRVRVSSPRACMCNYMNIYINNLKINTVSKNSRRSRGVFMCGVWCEINCALEIQCFPKVDKIKINFRILTNHSNNEINAVFLLTAQTEIRGSQYLQNTSINRKATLILITFSNLSSLQGILLNFCHR